MAQTVKVFFKAATISHGEGEESQSFAISQLMPAGAPLVGLEGTADAGNSQKAPAGSIELIPGSHVEFSADKKALLASRTGYPRMSRKKQGTDLRVVVDIEPLLSLNADGWTAKLTLYPPLDDSLLPACAEITAMLEKDDVRYGIREKSIASCLELVAAKRLPLKEQIVARGRMPVNGENSRLRIAVAVGAQPGRELGDGRIDFRERRMFTGVDKGQLLATKIAATSGIAGKNIFGQEIPQTPGKDLLIRTGPDITYNEETGEIRAAISGVLSVINDTSIKVSAKHVISGDIDYTTGNIDSRDAVEISGSLKPGFKVMAGGDILIGGNIESAHVISRANVSVRGGMTGRSSAIKAEGDIDIPFVEHGSLSCRGSVTIKRQVYYTDIRSGGDITLEGEAKVVGSRLYAGGSIIAFEIDTVASPNSFLAAAIDPARYTRYQELMRDVQRTQAKIEAWQHRFGPEATNDDLREMEEELSEVLTALRSFNLIPVSSEQDRAGGLRYACRQKIVVSRAIQAGAVIRIGNVEVSLKKTYAGGHFAINSEKEKIEFYMSSRIGALSAQPV